jgi:glycosyltransferase involved in cell wall biosynthesis
MSSERERSDPIPVHHLTVGIDGGDYADAVDRAATAYAHLLVLPADAVPAVDALDALRSALEADPMFGFAVPRTNVGDTWSAAVPSRDALDAVAPLIDRDRPWHFVPTAASLCVLVRNSIVAELHVQLATALAEGSLEQLSLDSNRLGYRTIVADAASITLGLRRDVPPLRGDDYERAERLHRLTPESRLEPHIAHRAANAGAPTLLFDLSGFRLLHNGTTECTKAIVRGVIDAASPYSVHMLCEPEVARYHRLAELAPGATIHPPETTRTFDVALRIGVPFELAEVARLADRAVTNIYMALDTIAWDCAYVRPRQLDAVWRLVAETADGLLFNSDFTAELFLRRFPEAVSAARRVSPHSFDARDYGGDAIGARSDRSAPLLIVGNHFDHKYVAPTLERLLAALPEERFTALGLKGHASERVRAIPSGALDDEGMRQLYLESRAVIIPSHYEGFGFPIAHGLATGRPVLARDTPLNRDFRERWNGPRGLSLYRSTDELIALLAAGAPPVEPKSGTATEPWTWKRSGEDIAGFIGDVHERLSGERVRRRLARIAQLETIATVAASRAGVDTRTLSSLGVRLRRVPGVRRFVRWMRRR